jgi:hypothetical protein
MGEDKLIANLGTNSVRPFVSSPDFGAIGILTSLIQTQIHLLDLHLGPI